MGLIDWIKDKLDGDEPKPAAPVQGPKVLAPKPSQSFPGVGSQPSWHKAVGAPTPKPWTPSPTGTGSNGVPKAVNQAMGPEFETAVKTLSKPTAAEYQIMSALGWQMPEDAAPSVVASPYKTEDPRDLVAYSYMPEKEEVLRIQEVYKGMPGFTAPDEKITENAPPPMFGSQGVLPQEAKLKETPVATELQQASLSWEEYDKLSEDQRKAVDFNTLLVRAREQDLSNSQAFTPDQRKMYDTEVQGMFGESGGSETYAPNTVALLKQIDFKAVGQDLDEYLSLERAFTADEIKGFKIEGMPELKQMGEGGTNYEGARQRTNVEAAEVAAVTKSADAISKAMQDATAVLDTFYATMEQGRLPIMDTLGGKPLALSGAPGEQVGFPLTGQTYTVGDEASEKAKFFSDNYAAAAAGQMDQVWESIRVAGLNDAEQQELFSYFDTRSAQEARWGRPTGSLVDTESVTYQKPDEIRAALGLGG
jgi:hypothetical protein